MKRHHSGGGGPGMNLSAIITPMLDMAFQILAFFIMTYHPSALEGHIPGSLVPPENIAKKGTESAPADPTQVPQSVDPSLLEEGLTAAVLVKIESVPRGQTSGNRVDGEPKKILLKLPTDTSYQQIADTANELSIEQGLKVLDTKLKEVATQPGSEKANIKIEGDGDLKQQYVMRVYDVCKRAGYAKVHFVPPPMLREAK